MVDLGAVDGLHLVLDTDIVTPVVSPIHESIPHIISPWNYVNQFII